MAHKPNIYIVGFMGTGKSTVGGLLAQRLELQFIDSDKCIEGEQHRTISQIFDDEGEPYFRQLERDFVDSGHPKTGCVVACGGGLVVQNGMVEKLKRMGLVACLFASPETILERTSYSQTRPLLDAEDPCARIRELLAAREKIYLKAGTCLLTDKRPMAEVVANLERFYYKEAGRR